MVQCLYGSEPKPTAPAYFWQNEAAWRLYLPTALDWLAPYLPPATGNILYETADYCQTEPPEPEEFTAEDLLLVSRNPLLIGALIAKAAEWVAAGLFAEHCQCSAGAAYACSSTDYTNNQLQAVGTYLLFAAKAAPGPARTFEHTVHVDSADGTTRQHWIKVHGAEANNDLGAVLEEMQVVAGNDYVFNGTLTGTQTQFRLFYKSINQAGTGTAVVDGSTVWTDCYGDVPYDFVDYGEPAQPDGVPDPPVVACATTEDLCDRIAFLTQRLAITDSMVTLIQRQAVPFASVPGTSHPGLTGSGSFAVQGILALSANITTLPSAYGQVFANPTLLWDVGYVAIGTADGWLPAHRLQHDPLLLFPPLGGMITQVAYYLRPGVVLTILELLRES